jgi:hypothetical protein
MNLTADATWIEANQTYLGQALAELKETLRRHATQFRASSGEQSNSAELPAADQLTMPSQPADRNSGQPASPSRPPALDLVVTGFHLSPFERDILLLCAAMELDSEFGPLCSVVQGDSARNYPTFSLALAALPNAHWSALLPEAPLRRWRLIEPDTGPVLTLAPLRIDERVLHYLVGLPQLDERLAGMIEILESVTIAELVPSHAAVVERMLAAWSAAELASGAPVIQLCGAASDCRPLAAAAAKALGLRAAVIPASLIPANATELESLLRLWEREAVLSRVGVLLVEGDDLDFALGVDEDRTRGCAITRLIGRSRGLIIVCERERRRIAHRPNIAFSVGHPLPEEQRNVWQVALSATDPAPVDAVAAQFNLSAAAIRSVIAEALARVAGTANPSSASSTETAWEVCRTRLRAGLDRLAQRIDTAVSWEDLVLPDLQRQVLREMAAHVRQRITVYDRWGFAAKSSRGLGMSALFAGPSGTGKTMAAEVLANELRLDLYRIDLSSVVSKYIGETEKNLRRVFDAAEESGAILLFDEADALFGKRSEVKDSHDRYANIEVSYLLQRMEAYSGLAILTTNLKSALDQAFLRRLRFVVHFPFPDQPKRAEIWRRIFPAATPIEGLDVLKLAKLNIPGGNIRNVAMNAAFLAADASEPVRMRHLLAAARSEYAKLERTLTEVEFGGWI